MVGLSTPKNSAGSAYPPSVDALLPHVRERVAELGSTPSRNRIMREFRVGASKARAILEALKGEIETAPVRKLHAVSESDQDAAPEPGTDAPSQAQQPKAEGQVTSVADSGPAPVRARPVRSWPLLLLALPAFVAIWSAWVGVGELAGFGPVRPLPGIADGFTINSAITLPIGMETYAAYAVRVWLAEGSSGRARRFAKYSAIAAFVLGGLGQIAYHLMTAAHMTAAPWPVTTAVSCLPVVVLGFGAALVHLQRDGMEGTR